MLNTVRSAHWQFHPKSSAPFSRTTAILSAAGIWRIWTHASNANNQLPKDYMSTPFANRPEKRVYWAKFSFSLKNSLAFFESFKRFDFKCLTVALYRSS